MERNENNTAVADLVCEGLRSMLTETRQNPAFDAKKYIEDLAKNVRDDGDLRAVLPCIKKLLAENDEDLKLCDARAKQFADEKKNYEAQASNIKRFTIKLLANLRHKSFSAGDTKVSVSVREALDVTDKDALLARYVNSLQYAELAATLPAWVKVDLSIDKNALKNHVKEDSSLLVDHPEWLSTKESTSITIK